MTRSRDLANLADGTEFSAADHSKLDGIEASATADQTSAQIKAAVEAATDSNVFTDADHSKLNAVEASADVTDTANVTAAGALMDSELTNLAAVKAINQSLVTTATPTFAGLATTANVGIGTSSPARLAEIYGTTNPALRLNNGTANVDIGIATSSGALLTGSSANDLVIARNGAYNIKIGTNGTTRMTLDASGNVLVGTNNAAQFNTSTETGSQVSDGYIAVARPETVAYFNRLSTDGDIVSFRKGGSTVGSIGTTSGDITIDGASEHTGLRFEATDITPRHNGAASNGVNDLGTSSNRFKDLYLSGGVVFGPASASNVSSQTLDSYEEGSFTPTVGAGYSSPSYNIQVGRYTKVGNTVRAYFRVAMSGGTVNSSGVVFSGLPYAAVNHGSVYTAGTHYTNNASAGGENSVLLVFPNNAAIYMYVQAATGVGPITGATSGNALDVLGQVVYEAA